MTHFSFDHQQELKMWNELFNNLKRVDDSFKSDQFKTFFCEVQTRITDLVDYLELDIKDWI